MCLEPDTEKNGLSFRTKEDEDEDDKDLENKT